MLHLLHLKFLTLTQFLRLLNTKKILTSKISNCCHLFNFFLITNNCMEKFTVSLRHFLGLLRIKVIKTYMTLFSEQGLPFSRELCILWRDSYDMRLTELTRKIKSLLADKSRRLVLEHFFLKSSSTSCSRSSTLRCSCRL